MIAQNSDAVYSATLAAAVIAVSLALGLVLLSRYVVRRRRGSSHATRLDLAARWAAVAALVLVAASAWVHACFDHSDRFRAGSWDMGPALFVREHKAFIVAALAATLVLGWPRPRG